MGVVRSVAGGGSASIMFFSIAHNFHASVESLCSLATARESDPPRRLAAFEKDRQLVAAGELLKKLVALTIGLNEIDAKADTAILATP